MRYFLSKGCRSIAAQLAAERTLCAFDYDGTLAPIVAHPDQARMRARTRRLLARLAAAYPCAVISGRARADLRRHLAGVRVAGAIGNHGAETSCPARTGRRLTESWLRSLAPAVASLAGVWIEDKEYTLAVHYRQARWKREARRAILEVVHTLQGARALGGKQVVNVLPSAAPGKGAAVVLLRKRLHCASVLYVGDDENDEDAFALEGNVVAVRIGRARDSRAGYFLREQVEIDALLELMIGLRASGPPSDTPAAVAAADVTRAI
jgi:trehalose 6-phosphate phosphatase